MVSLKDHGRKMLGTGYWEGERKEFWNTKKTFYPNSNGDKIASLQFTEHCIHSAVCTWTELAWTVQGDANAADSSLPAPMTREIESQKN